MKENILALADVGVRYINSGAETAAVKNMTISLRPGDRLGIIGESGSGKTTLAHAIMGLLDGKAEVTGSIRFNGMELTKMSETERDCYRWNKIAIVFQNGMNTLNPVLPVRTQIAECIDRHLKLPKEQVNRRVGALLDEVGLDRRWAEAYPNQLSGGMLQRVLIAMALSCGPELLIIDEPTTALDAIAKKDIIELLMALQRQKRFAMLIASHELSVIRLLTDTTFVMYQGCAVEAGLTEQVILEPVHPYTRGLINSSTQINCYRDLWGIPSENKEHREQGCPFHPRCHQKLAVCAEKKPPFEINSESRRVACHRGGIATVLEGSGISKTYKLKGRSIVACRNVDISLRSGEVVALIGESGSGKSTLASILGGFLSMDSGTVFYDGRVIRGFDAVRHFSGIQMTFQDPFSSINEHFTIRQAVEEPLALTGAASKPEREGLVIQALCDVQLPAQESFLNKRCFMLSGGQRQRVAVARSLVMRPRVLIADEISSMLDPSTQANILRLLKGLQNAKGFSMLYITHDLSLARKIADRVYIMKNAQIIESGPALTVFRQPQHEYTRQLLNCAML